MVLDAQRDRSGVGIFLVSGMSPVGLVHPTGESFVNHPDGPFLQAFCAGPARCHACREQDGHRAERPTGELTAEQFADYDAAAIRTVFGFLRRADELGCLRNSISIGKREVPAAPPPKLTLAERWKSRQRGTLVYPPSTANEYEHFEGHTISTRQRNAGHGDTSTRIVHLSVWV